MRQWEDVESLSAVLDRHRHAILSHGTSDWSVYWALCRYIEFLNAEPVLRILLADMVERTRNKNGQALKETQKLFTRMRDIVVRHQMVLTPAFERMGDTKRQSFGLVDFPTLKAPTDDLELASAHLNKVLTGLLLLVPSQNIDEGDDAHTELGELFSLRDKKKALDLNLRRIQETDPGHLYLSLVREHQNLRVHDVDGLELAVQIQATQELLGHIDDYVGGPEIRQIPQPRLIRIQKAVESLNLSLVTALTRGASRKAVVRRFAARCTSFDRERLVQNLASLANAKPEAWLTAQFAQYLFDAGYNPIVDAAMCGLRPDVFDPSLGHAFYVEAKQYENVTEGTAERVQKDIAQALNTWGVLADRWKVPEAFLLIFRRSGAHLEFDSEDIRTPRGWLRIQVVDLAPPENSGSRTKKVVTVRTEDLEVASASGDDKGEAQ